MPVNIGFAYVVPGRLELPTSTLSVWRSNQLSYRTGLNRVCVVQEAKGGALTNPCLSLPSLFFSSRPGNLLPSPSESQRSRKEVFQPHLPVRLPCYDLAPIPGFTLGRPSRSRTSGAPGFHGLTGGVYKARERIHRAMAAARLLANPASWGRVADPSTN